MALVDNATIRRINRKHLAHDWPTDVISFTLSAAGEPELVGELVVSTEMAAATANEAERRARGRAVALRCPRTASSVWL